MLRILTPRLALVAAEPSIARAEAERVPGWCTALDVPPPASWPPPLNGADALHWFAAAVARDPGGVGWYSRYVVRRASRALIGHAGFKGRPDRHGSVEIGYSLLEEFHGRGFGSELVRALSGWAFGHAEVARVMADTYPELVASVRVLEKNGFTLSGRADRPGAIRFELRRAVHDARRSPSVIRRRRSGPRSRGPRCHRC